MKKTNSFFISQIVIFDCFSQTTPWDGEAYDLGSRGGCWDDGTPTMVANPDAI